MTLIETGTLSSEAARAALIHAESGNKRTALWHAKQAIERAGAIDERRKNFPMEINLARKWLDEAERAERNLQQLEGSATR